MEGTTVSYTISKHAQLVMEVRNIKNEWLNQVFLNPEHKEQDTFDPTVTRLFGKVVENGNRVLRVSVNFNKQPPMIVSVHFDRAMKGKI